MFHSVKDSSRCSLPMRNRALKSELATDALPIIRLRCRHHQVLNRETQSRYGNTRLIFAAAGGTTGGIEKTPPIAVVERASNRDRPIMLHELVKPQRTRGQAKEMK